VLLGMVLLIVGVAVAVVVPQLPIVNAGGAPRLAGVFLVLGVAVAVARVVCMVKKPTRGSSVGTARYEELVAARGRGTYRSAMRAAGAAVIGFAGFAVAALISGIGHLLTDSGQGVVLFAVCAVLALAAVVFVLGVSAARRGRFNNLQPPSD